MKTDSSIRKPAVNGLFYPASERELRRQVQSLLDACEPPAIDGTIRALVVPHAGYMYSGLTAALAYSTLRAMHPATVVILSPSHREWFTGVSIYPGSAYRTPLGPVPIDKGVREALASYGDTVTLSEAGHRGEHAIEVQLPFLQLALGECSFVPLVFGEQSADISAQIGEMLHTVLRGRDAVVIASSDLSHYHAQTRAVVLDGIAATDIASGDAERFFRHIEAGKTEACGASAVGAVMTYAALAGADATRILHQTTSAAATGDQLHVVGYLSAALWKKR